MQLQGSEPDSVVEDEGLKIKRLFSRLLLDVRRKQQSRSAAVRRLKALVTKPAGRQFVM